MAGQERDRLLHQRIGKRKA